MYLALVGPNTFMPIQGISKKQSVVSHSFTESEIVEFDFGLRSEGMVSMTFWEHAVRMFDLGWRQRRQKASQQKVVGDDAGARQSTSLYGFPPLPSYLFDSEDKLVSRPDFPTVPLVVMEDNQATILVVKAGWSPKLRHIQ